MACLSSPGATRWDIPAAHPRPRDVGAPGPRRLPFVQAQRFTANVPPSIKQSLDSKPVRHLSQSLPLKSPMSKSIANILGAAEAVNRRDAWLAKRYPMKRKAVPVIAASFRLPTNMGRIDELETMLEDKDLYRSLVLTMALERPRKGAGEAHPPCMMIGEGFYWKEYPKLEGVLYDQMAEYYSFSANQRQSKCQQAYNNTLVEKMKIEATRYGYTFDPAIFSDKKLRDRIRCFYKTHLQNAKKRLSTLQKHLDAPEQRRALFCLIGKAQELVPELAATLGTSSDTSSHLVTSSDDESYKKPRIV